MTHYRWGQTAIDVEEWPQVAGIGIALADTWVRLAEFKGKRATDGSAASLRRFLAALAALGNPPAALSELDWATLEMVREEAADIRHLLEHIDTDRLHPSLVRGRLLCWTPKRSPEAVVIYADSERVRGTWLDPNDFPVVLDVARSLAACFARVPSTYSSNHIQAFGQAARSLLAWLSQLAVPPRSLAWVSADFLDQWVEHVQADGGTIGGTLAWRMRDLLENRPVDVAVHGSLLGGDGALRWVPSTRWHPAPSADLAFSTLEALRARAIDDVLRALGRLAAVEQTVAESAVPQTQSEWMVEANVLRLALDCGLSRANLRSNLGDDPGAWPDWLKARSDGRSPCASAVSSIYNEVFPTPLEVTAAYVLMLLATGLPPESVIDLESSWFLAHAMAHSSGTLRYGPACRIRFPKGRKGSRTEALLFSTRTAWSPIRVRDITLRLTRGLRRLAPSACADRLFVVVAPRSLVRAPFLPVVAPLSHVTVSAPGSRAGGRPFISWLTCHGLDDPDRMQAWNDSRRQVHAARMRTQAERIARSQEAGSRGIAPFRPFSPWTGSRAPQRIRKTMRTRDIVLHGALGAARDHSAHTLVVHYSTSEVLRVVAALAVNEAQRMLHDFAADPDPALLVVPRARLDQADAAEFVAGLLGIPDEVVAKLASTGSRMGNGLCCVDPSSPPPPRELASDGYCTNLGSQVCFSCPNSVAVTDDDVVGVLRSEVRRLERRAHVHFENPLAGRLHDDYRRIITSVLAIADDGPVTPEPPETANALAIPKRRRRA